MTARTPTLAVLALSAALVSSPVRAAGKVTLDGLLRQMTDLSALAEFPDPPYVSRQFSSYDRASVSPADKEGWFANNDRGFPLYDGTVGKKTGYFRKKPGREPDGYFKAGTKVGVAANRPAAGKYVWAYATGPDGRPVKGQTPQGYIPRDAIKPDPDGHVLADMDGPGCVVRIWSPNPNDAGNLRIYLDGSQSPVINAPMQALLEGKWQVRYISQPWTPFPEPLAHMRPRGWNLYFPIAYARHCKICTDQPNIYYHIDYRTYPPGTAVETFTLARFSLEKPAAEAADKLGTVPPPPANSSLSRGRQMVKPGAEYGFHPGKDAESGPGAVAECLVRLRNPGDQAQALRTLVLTATFDAAAGPQVWCPLGDFFASSPGVNRYQALPFTVARRPNKGKPVIELTARWWMPYEKSALFKIQNLGTQAADLEYELRTVPYRWTARSMHFHAKWRTAWMRTRPFRDWTFCNVEGRGVFVGAMLSVLNPVKAWWGEGDEKIYVDGESFPSWFGTGTEDYFGYGWGDPTPFQHPYHNQTRCDGPESYGHTSVNRFHILDAIPFTRSFHFDMEVWHWAEKVEVNYAATSYWYARPGATDDFRPAGAETLRAIPSPPPPFQIAGAIEGERMKFLAMSSRFPVDPQPMVDFPSGRWSGNAQLWARPGGPGQWVDLRLPVAADGTYHLIVYMTKAQDYGIVQFFLSGKRIGKPFDGFHMPKVVPSGPVDLGTVDLKKGGSTLRIQVVGTNPRSVGSRFLWGLDCVVLKPAGK